MSRKQTVMIAELYKITCFDNFIRIFFNYVSWISFVIVSKNYYERKILIKLVEIIGIKSVVSMHWIPKDQGPYSKTVVSG